MGMGLLKHKEDPYLQHYNIQIDSNMTIVSTFIVPWPRFWDKLCFLLTLLDACTSPEKPRSTILEWKDKPRK
jgi:hypothetical protein